MDWSSAMNSIPFALKHMSNQNISQYVDILVVMYNARSDLVNPYLCVPVEFCTD